MVIFFFYQNNGMVSLSPLLVFFCKIYMFPPRGLVWSLIGITDYIRNTLLGDHIIAIYWFWFSPSTMVSYHCHHYWLLFFVVFRHFFPTDDCDHLLGSLITFEVLCWAIVSELFIMFVFLPERWCCITVTVDDCCCMSFFLVSSPSMNLIILFYFSLFPLRGWVPPLVMITYYIWSTLLSYHISAIHPYRLDYVVSHSIFILFKSNGDVSSLP